MGNFTKPTVGRPQGGVISPLLSNIYLNYIDTIWEKKFRHLGHSSDMRTTLSSYAKQNSKHWRVFGY